MIRFLAIILLLGAPLLECFPQATRTDSLRAIVGRYGQAYVRIPYREKSSMQFPANVSVSWVKENQIQICLSPLTVEWFIQQKFSYAIDNQPALKALHSIIKGYSWDNYPLYSQYDSLMRKFTADYPDLCLLDTIGMSVDDRPVLVIKISDNALSDEDEPDVFYTSSMHGNETGGFMLMLRLIDHLLRNYKSDERITNLVENLQIWINPLANPDGTYRGGDAIVTPVRFNANGYDLNRNFPDPAMPTGPLQKENADMIDFMKQHRFVMSANFHSGSEVVNYPWDRWLYRIHADDEWFSLISRAYADTVHKYSPPGYMDDLDNGITRGALWYVIYGGRQDYVTYELGGREVTIELDDNFITPPENLGLLWQYNRQSLIGYIENALYGIHGKVTDASTMEPVRARITVQGHDKDSSHIYSNSGTGRYVRLLAPGSWTLSFKAPGYRESVIGNIPLMPRMKAIEDVSLSRLPGDSARTGKPVLYPNPARKKLNVSLPDAIAGNVNVKILSLNGTLIFEDTFVLAKKEILGLDLNNFAAGSYEAVFSNRKAGVTYKSRFIVIK